MRSIKPEDLIGKYLAYDAPASKDYPHGYGSVFAKIIAVNRNSKDQVLLITDNMRIRHIGKIHTYKGQHRVLYFDEIMKRGHMPPFLLPLIEADRKGRRT